MANFNLLDFKRRLGEPITPEDYERQIERLQFLNDFLRLQNETLRRKRKEENAQKNKLTNWLKNLIN